MSSQTIYLPADSVVVPGSVIARIEDTAGNALSSSGGALNVNLSGGSSTTDANINGLDSFQTSQYVVGTSEIQITVVPLANRSSISLKVATTGQNIIYFCQSSGSVLTQGYPLSNGDSLQMDLTPSGNIYVQATAPGQNLYVLEIA